jgi:hypothetical protein
MRDKVQRREREDKGRWGGKEEGDRGKGDRGGGSLKMHVVCRNDFLGCSASKKPIYERG